MEELQKIMEQVWTELPRAAAGTEHPFRTPVLATSDGPEPGLRVVVLRAASAALRELICFTDARSAKVAHLRACSRPRWLFFDPVGKVQVIAAGRTSLHHGDEVARGWWQTAPEAHRWNYCSPETPGSVIAEPRARERGQPLDPAHAAFGLQNFTVLRTEVDRLDWLQLHPDGNRRAQFDWRAGSWIGRWVAP